MKDLTGKIFSRLTVLLKSENKSKDNKVLWECKCICGRFLPVRTNHLISGHTTSCGCSRKTGKKYAGTRLSAGWTPELVVRRRSEQGNACAICKEIFNKTPNADHKHSNPPRPRGLLCTSCNLSLGLLKDNPELALKAAQYLLFWK